MPTRGFSARPRDGLRLFLNIAPGGCYPVPRSGLDVIPIFSLEHRVKMDSWRHYF